MTRSRQPKFPVRTHGVGGYGRGCPCDLCLVAWREYSREYRRRQRAALAARGLTSRGTIPKRSRA